MVGDTFGPRAIPYVASDGRNGNGNITITFGETKSEEFEDGDRLEWKTGWIDVDFDGESHRFTAEGADDIQLVYFLMERAGLWLTTVAQRRGIALFDYRPEPVKGPMDIFDC